MLNKNLKIPTVPELFRSIRNIRENWKCKTPLQKWSYLFGIGRAACVVVKVPLFEEDQTLSLWAYQGFLYFGSYFLLGLYTVYYYHMSGEIAKSLPCTCLFVGPIVCVSFQLNRFHQPVLTYFQQE